MSESALLLIASIVIIRTFCATFGVHGVFVTFVIFHPVVPTGIYKVSKNENPIHIFVYQTSVRHFVLS